MYINLKSGAESGWDYSSKWFMNEAGNVTKDLKDIKTREISPVELNSYLCKNARILSEFFTLLGNEDKAAKYKGHSEDFATAMDEVMWNNEQGAWFDYDMTHKKQRVEYFITNIAPLWANCHK